MIWSCLIFIKLYHRVAFDNKIFFLSILALVSEELPDVPCKLNHMKIMIKPCHENISTLIFSVYYLQERICALAKIQMAKDTLFRSAIINAGYRVS